METRVSFWRFMNSWAKIGLAQGSHHMEHDDCFDCSVILEFDGSAFFDGPLDCFNHALGRYGVIQR